MSENEITAACRGDGLSPEEIFEPHAMGARPHDRARNLSGCGRSRLSNLRRPLKKMPTRHLGICGRVRSRVIDIARQAEIFKMGATTTSYIEHFRGATGASAGPARRLTEGAGGGELKASLGRRITRRAPFDRGGLPGSAAMAIASASTVAASSMSTCYDGKFLVNARPSASQRPRFLSGSVRVRNRRLAAQDRRDGIHGATLARRLLQDSEEKAPPSGGDQLPKC